MHLFHINKITNYITNRFAIYVLHILYIGEISSQKVLCIKQVNDYHYRIRFNHDNLVFYMYHSNCV